jgi:hypothetical protein
MVVTHELKSVKFVIEVGILIRRYLRNLLIRERKKRFPGLSIEFDEEKGILSSTFSIRVSGDSRLIPIWCEVFANHTASLNDRNDLDE